MPVELTPTSTPIEEPLYLSIVWHQHQPLYYKDADGLYTRPWVRVHATKDYYDMAAVVQEYPNVHVTFNLTPVLLRQLDDFADKDAKDKYWALAEKPAAELTEADKDFILRRFFDVNWDHIIARFPRYKELLDKRGGTDDAAIAAALKRFTEPDYRDLQIWFNLAWFDPDFLAQIPLKGLVEKDHGFDEENKAVLFAEARRIIKEIVPLHKQMQDAGQIEIITTPYAHPILPLIFNTSLARVGNPGAMMGERFAYPRDTMAQLEESVKIYQSHFGKLPRGMWPGEGAVAQEVVSFVSEAGYRWMASGEPVLAASLGLGSFSRDAQGTVQEADKLYRPYYVQGQQGQPVLMIFRDWTISDKIGFDYSKMPGEAAAQDFMNRLENIRARLKQQGATGPHLVSVILDGENAWENYEDDGKVFFHALYQKLSESTTIQTVTPSEYMTLFPKQEQLDNLFPGAWFSANYDTWIGEPEEMSAWNYLLQVRSDLARYDVSQQRTAPSPEALKQALDFMYLAEGSDWFWWYGTDQDSGNDAYFDEGFRALLANVYKSLGEPVPMFVNVPIIQAKPAAPVSQFGGLFSPTIDGEMKPDDEWVKGAAFPAVGGAMARAEDVAASLYYGMDAKTIYLRLDAKTDWAALGDATVGFYVASPHLNTVLPYTHLTQETDAPTLLGLGATTLFEVTLKQGSPTATVYVPDGDLWANTGLTLETVAVKGRVLELGVPLEQFGQLEIGDDLRLVAVASQGERDLQSLPATGPAQIILPDLGLTTTVLEVNDPEADDNGSGMYSYPTDSIFEKQIFDLKTFSVGYDDENMVFKFVFYGPVPNPWGSPNNLAVQTLDVYVDKDPGAGTGARLLLPGRNAALIQGSGWEFALTAEGWEPKFVAADPTAPEPKVVTGVSFKIIVDAGNSTVTIRVPRSNFGEGDPATWGYGAAVLSQEGFPTAGVWRVRDGQTTAGQWKFGGVPDGATNYPRIFDLADTGDQAIQLMFTPSTTDVSTLTADDFAQVILLTVP